MLTGSDCRIEPYTAEFELTQNARGEYRDLLVTLSLTYRIGDTPKGDGFKFVGNSQVRDLTVTDGAGNPLVGRVTAMRETRLDWSFPEKQNSPQTVVARFRLVNALTGTLAENSFNARWAGVFRVPVVKTTFRFIFPPGYRPTGLKSPLGEAEARLDGSGRRVVEFSTPELFRDGFYLSFAPGLVAAGAAQQLRQMPLLARIFVAIWALFMGGMLLFSSIKCGRLMAQGKSFSTAAQEAGFNSSSDGGSSSSCSSCSSCGGCGGCGG